MTIPVDDPFDAAADPALPALRSALDPLAAKKQFKRRLPRLSGDGKLRLQAIRVTRHKPGRRCVIEYDVRIERPTAEPVLLTLIGKIRARRFGNESYRLQEQFWQAGFADSSPDGISVPEPLGIIAAFQMWVQRKVAGEPSDRVLMRTHGVDLARRIALAIHKVHRANVPTERTHRMADELRILEQCLAKVRELKPEWSKRLDALEKRCVALGLSVPEPQTCGIHRDFYPAQVIVDNGRLYLIDFDLYCLGDPALDVGNFVAHVIEQSLREVGDPCRFRAQEEALGDEFLKLAGQELRPALRAYTLLSLARHIYLSTQFPERQRSTACLLELCEQRLADHQHAPSDGQKLLSP